ncbi:DUF305 domain-containing protein [Leptolyngbya sp. FACHB-711]|uniref:DUF305 domain-containing protein n=1 Tax=unclassified Leptolyngbya TaxID=2650499 RepID=UPI001683858C|nr:DUF305 domain-containing protein [Leptolyngbya sp. FACHB-711]MBD1850364.1 DUF305 domain-containing protein [Cyanobacteria bacterium FACHB-502]MBD2024086.1 DUF305 domain-containing protein [Leptolyngbya sp. FACHB-711]
MRSKLILMTATALTTLMGCAMPEQNQAQQMDHSNHSPQMQAQGGNAHNQMMHEMQVSSEQDYLTQMIPHHQEAIDSAKIMLERSDRPEMKQFAQEVIRVQSTEVQQMQKWLSEWYPGQPTQANYQPMMGDLTQLQGDALDRAFLEGMVMHHKGAVTMSQQLLSQNLVKHEPVRPFAEQIASSQQQEIQQMQAWLKEWFGASSMTHH